MKIRLPKLHLNLKKQIMMKISFWVWFIFRKHIQLFSKIFSFFLVFYFFNRLQFYFGSVLPRNNPTPFNPNYLQKKINFTIKCIFFYFLLKNILHSDIICKHILIFHIYRWLMYFTCNIDYVYTPSGYYYKHKFKF